jgi:hypothetical protein
MHGPCSPAFGRDHADGERERNSWDLQGKVAKVLQSGYWVAAKECSDASHAETANGQHEETAKQQDEPWRSLGMCTHEIRVRAEDGPGNQRSDDRAGNHGRSLLEQKRDDHTGNQPGEYMKLGVEGQD